MTSNVTYIPEGHNEALPMYITSGVVTKITLVLLMLENEDLKIM
jgi:hypothetical protein